MFKSESSIAERTNQERKFGFPDAILQMWAAFCDELVNGRAGMKQHFTCATPEEASWSHDLFTAALASQREGKTVALNLEGATASGK